MIRPQVKLLQKRAGLEPDHQRHAQLVVGLDRAGIVIVGDVADPRRKCVGHLEVHPQLIVDPRRGVRGQDIVSMVANIVSVKR